MTPDPVKLIAVTQAELHLLNAALCERGPRHPADRPEFRPLVFGLVAKIVESILAPVPRTCSTGDLIWARCDDV